MENWVEGDDPIEEHTKFFPNCVFLQTLKASADAIPAPQSHCARPEAMETTRESNHEDGVAVHSSVADLGQSEAQWFQEARSLSEQLRGTYTKASFRHMNLPGIVQPRTDPTCLAAGVLISKACHPASASGPDDPRGANLSSVMCVGGGWQWKDNLPEEDGFSSGHQDAVPVEQVPAGLLPLLRSIRADQGLADIICAQLPEAGGCISEVSLSSGIQHLQHQVLFLLDDYSGMDSLPQALDTLITKNYLSRTCLLMAVHTNRVRDIRPYLDTVLQIKEFPFYNTVYILKKIFSHDIIRVRRFICYFHFHKYLQGIQKTPLFVAGVCTDWLQNPSDQPFQDVTIFKSYMQYLFLKHKATAGPLQATVSSCGHLALTGLFSSSFEFSSDDLAEAGVDEDEELTTCLMSKFTAQRLRPVYRFLNPLFQEFLAAMRLSELLGSDSQEDQDLGLYYLRQINSPLKAMSIYHTFLRYVSNHPSSKAGPKVVSHLLQLVDEKESPENMSENEHYMKFHPETLLWSQCLRGLLQLSPESFSLFISERLLSIALNFAYQSNTVAACSPVILQFLQGRTLDLKVLNLQYFLDHPETLLLLKSIQVLFNGNNRVQRIDFSLMDKSFEKIQPPTIDQDYAFAFQPMSECQRNLAEKENIIKNYDDMKYQDPLNISSGYWKLSPKPYKIPRLEVGVNNMGPADQALLHVLMEIFSASQSIEFHLFNSSGFLESIRPALELNKTSVTKCSMSRLELSRAEQELLLTLSALQSLEMSVGASTDKNVNNNNTSRHARMEERTLTDSKPWKKNYRQLVINERGRVRDELPYRYDHT
ncbi:baculoviral IAP repeat-containing protein 1b-like [Rattus rattus]|uniref:baculoviral IAP repeat-containing protein 1b-like n=1 Tax=Rattus rattus TaxID=10117 RepID=UPI0013F34F42|nr:baculoviral IAP repeat-containing protein 1b-like [Rattus rattus]